MKSKEYLNLVRTFRANKKEVIITAILTTLLGLLLVAPSVLITLSIVKFIVYIKIHLIIFLFFECFTIYLLISIITFFYYYLLFKVSSYEEATNTKINNGKLIKAIFSDSFSITLSSLLFVGFGIVIVIFY